MGLVSPSASAKRRMAPFSISLTRGLDSRPIALRSTTMRLLPARGQIEDGDEARLGAVHERSSVDHRPGGGLVARRAARDEALQARVALELNLVARVGGAERDGQLEVGHFPAVVEGARHLMDPGDSPLRDAQ